MGEFAVLAAAIDAGNDSLPSFIGNMIQNAPQSFDDLRAGEIAATVRAMRHAGEPINFPAIGEKHLPFLTFVTEELPLIVLPLDVAECEAEKCWQAFQIRRAKTVAMELAQSLNDRPQEAPAIIAEARVALDVIAGGNANEFTIRTPDEILEMVFNDQDIIVGDRIMAEGSHVCWRQQVALGNHA